jgi:hypothetical protein
VSSNPRAHHDSGAILNCPLVSNQFCTECPNISVILDVALDLWL